jgi:membrane fusion protein (multidrug efflux system)
MLPKYTRIIAVLIVALAGCGSKDEQGAAAKPAAAPAAAPAKPGGMPVKAVPVKVDTVLSEVSAVGSLLAAESVVIRPEIAGRVTDLPFKEGQIVQKGAKLLTIDSSELEAALTGSHAHLKTEQAKLERARDLLKQNYISQEAVDNQMGAVSVAQAKVREDEARLSKTVINAPFHGVLGLRLISPGAYVKAGDDVVRLENMDFLKMDFRVPEIYVSKLKTQQAVSVRTDAFMNQVFEGHIYALEPNIDEKTRTLLVRAEIPNKEGKLRPGMFGRVNVLLEKRPNALIIPEQAIWPQGRDSFVYRVVDGVAALTKIEIGNRSPGEVEVIQGLKANDMVITDGQMKIKDGAPVTVMPSAPPAAAAATPAAVAPAASASGTVKK